MGLKTTSNKFYRALLQWMPGDIGIRWRQKIYKKWFKKSSSFIIESNVTIKGFENIELGDNVRFKPNTYIYAHANGNLSLGNNFSMNTNSFLGAAHGTIIVGDNCIVAQNCVIRCSNHKYDRVDIPIIEQGHEAGIIQIDKDVWIAANCVVTPNTKIGPGCVIGAGSIVTKDIPPYSVAVGNPAVVIKKRT